jgi:hypothetical protein
MEETIGTKQVQKRYCLGPLWAYQNGRKRGTAFINIILRTNLRMSITLQIRDRKNYREILEEYHIILPIPGLKKMVSISESIKKIRNGKNNEKWEIKEYEINKKI